MSIANDKCYVTEGRRALWNDTSIIYSRPYNYGDNIEDDILEMMDIVSSGERIKVFFVDCCPYGEENYFDQLYRLLGDNLIIIDHHKTAIEYIRAYEKEHNVKITSELFIAYSGCELTQFHIQKNISGVDASYATLYQSISPLYKLAGAYDIHLVDCEEFNWEDEILPFQYYLRTQVPNLTDIITKNAFIDSFQDTADFIKQICDRGKSVLTYIKSRNMNLWRSGGHESKVIFSGKERLVYNRCLWVSDYFNSSQVFSDNGIYNDPNCIYAIIKPQVYTGGYDVSLFSTPDSLIDVSRIAESMGGGGHFNAAGFKSFNIYIYYQKDINEKDTLLILPKSPFLD
jgi:hypothetical protein